MDCLLMLSVILIIVLAFTPEPIELRIKTPHMFGCKLVLRSLPVVMDVTVEGVVHSVDVLSARCVRI